MIPSPPLLPRRYEHTASLLARAARPGPLRATAVRTWADVMRDPTRARFTLHRHLRAATALRRYERRFIAAGLYALVRHHRLLAAALGIAEDDARRLWLAWLMSQGLDAAIASGDLGLATERARTLERASAAALDACDPTARLALAGSLPDDAARRLLADLGDDALPFLAACATRGALHLRVSRRTTREAALARLTADGIAAEPHPAVLTAIVAARCDIRAHALYQDGLIEVQDAGSQHVAQFASAQPGERVVDLCAGGGGKTLVLAEDVGDDGRVWAWDIRGDRLEGVRERAARADLARRITIAELPPDGTADRVLVDAPCSGSGTLRRDPTLRWRLRDRDVDAAREQQRDVLARASRLLSPRGTLIYATCSIFRAENQAALTALDGFERDGAELLTLPHRDDTDGFYAARLRRR